MSIRYGQIVCDPTSEEAKALIGKRVVASSNFSVIQCRPNEMHTCTLEDIYYRDSKPFQVRYIDWNIDWHTFIREVIEEELEPQYRPYTGADEMAEDYCERFGIVKTDYSMPMIWLRDKSSVSRTLVVTFGINYVTTSLGRYALKEVLRHFTYLDGSPVGRKIEG